LSASVPNQDKYADISERFAHVEPTTLATRRRGFATTMSHLHGIKAASSMASNRPFWGWADIIQGCEGLARAYEFDKLGVVNPRVPTSVDAELGDERVSILFNIQPRMTTYSFVDC
jgi:hypothetical protein